MKRFKLTIISMVIFAMTGCQFPAVNNNSANIEQATKLAEQGDAKSQFYLGTVAYNGQFMPKDLEKAFKFFSLAAAQGMRNAKTNVGIMLKNGEGVPKDLDKAFDILVETAELGDTTAQINLAGMYYFGEGTAVDYVQAYKWAKISDQIIQKEALNNLGNYNAVAFAASRADTIESKLSQDQLALGNQLANEWLIQHPDSH